MNIHRILGTVVHVLILVLLISFYINNRDNRTNLTFILCATIVYVCYLLEFVKRPNILELETFRSPLNAESIGPYNNIRLHNDGKFNLYDSKSTVKCEHRKDLVILDYIPILNLILLWELKPDINQILDTIHL